MKGLGDTLVLGLGRSGIATTRYLAGLVGSAGAESVTALDSGDTPALRAVAEELRSLGATVVLGADEVAGHFDLCVASPGIPPHAPLMQSALASEMPVISEIEFAFSRSTAPWVAVTGTNGKTTTTELLAHLLRCGGFDALAVGNVGSPAIEAVSGTSVLVAEVSSFQLALTYTFHPRVSVLLNITPDHIDWHGSMEAYAADKTRIFANQTEGDVAVIDVDDPGSAPYAERVEEIGVEVVRVSAATRHMPGATVLDGELALESRSGVVRLLPAGELQIRGGHNVSNALAAAAAAHAMGVSASDLREGLRTFAPIAHRLQPVGEVRGVEYVNDSKATNPDAVLKALSAFDERPVVVLLGGRNKGNDFTPLAEETVRTAKAAVLFGESRPQLEAAFSGRDFPVAGAADLRDAVLAAADLAEPGDVVLLSPACASFDEFRNYEDRGDRFAAIVDAMADEAAL